MLTPSSALLQSYIDKVADLMLSLDAMTQCRDGVVEDLEKAQAQIAALTKQRDELQEEVAWLEKDVMPEAE